MKTATATAPRKEKKPLPKLNAVVRLFDHQPRILNSCPGCDNSLSFKKMSPGTSENAADILVEKTVVCGSCNREVVIHEPKTSEQLDPSVAIPGDEAAANSTQQQGTDTLHEVPKLQEMDKPESRFERPLFEEYQDISEKIEQDEEEKPNFPVVRTAFLAAGIAIAFLILLGAAAYYFGVPLPQQKPQTGRIQFEIPQEVPRGDVSNWPSARNTLTPLPFTVSIGTTDNVWLAVAVDGKEEVPGELVKKNSTFIWTVMDTVTVRAGKPGVLNYFIDGHEVKPRNGAERPDLVELVTLTAASFPKEQ